MLLELGLRGGMPAKAAKKATKKPKKSGNNPKAGTKKAPKKAPKKKVAITAAPGATGGIAKKKGPISTKKKVGKKAVKVKKAIGTEGRQEVGDGRGHHERAYGCCACRVAYWLRRPRLRAIYQEIILPRTSEYSEPAP